MSMAHRDSSFDTPLDPHGHVIRPYDYRDAGGLVADFWAEVEALMREQGVWT